MIPTTNPQSYAQLLALYQTKVIETEAESDRDFLICDRGISAKID